MHMLLENWQARGQVPVKVEQYQKKSQDHEPKSKFLGLFVSTTSLVITWDAWGSRSI